MDRSVLEENSSFKMLGSTFSSKLDCGSYIISIAETVSKKIGPLIRSMKFLSPEVVLYLYKSTIWPCMNTVVIPGLVVLLIVTCYCWINFKNWYHIYSSEGPWHSFNIGFSKGGAYSREALFQGRRSLNISKRLQNTFNLFLYSNHKNNNNNRRINCLMFLLLAPLL